MILSRVVNVEFYLSVIKEKLSLPESFNWKENKDYAMKIMKFIHYYINKRHQEMHPDKLAHLKNARQELVEFIKLCNSQALIPEIAERFSKIENELDKYASNGCVYLLRHPDKTKQPGRSLSALGVKQAKHVAEMIKEDILLSPKKVRVVIRTSEIKRTKIFAKIIKHINKAKKIEKDVVVSLEEDKRLYQGSFSQSVIDIYMRLCKEHGSQKGDYLTFKAWVNKKEGFDEEIKTLGIEDHAEVRRKVGEFVKNARKKVKDKEYYTIVVGISHSWILDVWFLKYMAIQEIVGTAEYAKVELDKFFYKRKWKWL
ncbi:histidine phosphatase family protein [Nanoarchaeota archaeon]